ncbi:MAG: trypsin-like peptidase domain-containing protein [Candidatus Bathyarchaeota archaeon]|nr:trypsin-like peptidase domain-containing protein [Candidatus Bathyarchaeota archaeon]
MSQLSSLELLKTISDATAKLVEKLSKSVVSVNGGMSKGTGIVLNKEGHIATCNHVLHGCNTVRVGQGEKTFEARIVGVDPYNDLALLKTENAEFTPMENADSDNLSTGQFVLALANPFNHKQPTATTGIITNPNGTLRGFHGVAMENVIATDAKLNPGFSGGPLVDAEGKLIGINTAYVWNRGIAVPINKVKAITDRLITGKKVRKGYLGVVVNTVMVPRDIQERTGVEQETGVMVFQAAPDTPARKAGLIMGDVIVGFNGKAVTSFYDLPRLLAEEDVVDKLVKIKIIREEQLHELTITPAAKEGYHE